ncbi:MAG: ABC transporter ATP-binding protein [Burkholderiales bacterium]|nr:ABC transporter ATP-binding protein [Burkholderiales bacterium]
MAAIAVERLGKVFNRGSPREVSALREVTFSMASGEFVCILGPSGCGKSTILNILAGLESGFEGQVLLEGLALRSVGSALRVGYVFQESRLLPWLTVEQNVHFGLECQGFHRREWPARSAAVLEMVGLADFAHHYVHQLSGGMQQRTSIARALSIDPQILLMDEPFSSLDEFTARDLRQQLLGIWTRTGKTILFVTHNSFEATFLADRLLLMTRRPGRIVEDLRIDLPRPRSYDDPRVFDVNGKVVKTFFKSMNEP